LSYCLARIDSIHRDAKPLGQSAQNRLSSGGQCLVETPGNEIISHPSNQLACKDIRHIAFEMPADFKSRAPVILALTIGRLDRDEEEHCPLLRIASHAPLAA
jgi:hypothetical protein